MFFIFVSSYSQSLVGIDLPYLEKLKETCNLFQSPMLNLAVLLSLRNFSNMFVTELVVFAIVNYSFDMA